jgi:hypothetical protein
VAALPYGVPADVLTSDDLDAVGHTSFDADDPLSMVAELVAAVDGSRLANSEDDVYALSLAAEIAERCDDLSLAVTLAGRAAAIAQARGPRFGHARALYGELLLQAGREDEGMAVLGGLRGLLTSDENAVYYVSEALEQAGRTEVAVRWVTAALETALERRSAVASRRGDRMYEQAAVIGFALAQVRHRLRRELDLPHDDHDLLADRLGDAADEISAGEDDEHEGTAVLYWPRDQFGGLLLRWPKLADVYGATWHDHRTRLERGLVALSESGETRLAVFAGLVEELAKYVRHHGGDVTDPDLRQRYVEHHEQTRSTRRLWPPQRNEACWCGSGVKYKRCCLPRSRT